MKTYLWPKKRIPEEMSIDSKNVFAVEAKDIKRCFGTRRSESHKGTYGTVLVFGGSKGMEGAAGLAALSALKSGAGRVIMAIPKTTEIMYGISPEIMVRKLEDGGIGAFTENSIPEGKDLCKVADAVVLGPGFGRLQESNGFFEAILKEFKGPVLIDADGLYHIKYLIDESNWNAISENWHGVITPHIGEASNLLGVETGDIDDYRFESLSMLIECCKGTVVLKGHNTLISKDGEKVYINETGNPGMATAGSGDVLSGVIGAILARRDLEIAMDTAAAFGVWVHGLAGDLAADELGETGMIAGDIIKYLPYAWKEILK